MITNPLNLVLNKDNTQYLRSKTTANKPVFQKYLSINQDQINFTGLSKKLHKDVFIEEKQIAEIEEKNPKSNGLIANLPTNWINKIPKKDRPKLIKEIYSAFGEATMLLREAYKIFKLSNKAFKNSNTVAVAMEEASNIIKKALVHSGIIGNDENFCLKTLDSGSFGSAYQFKVGNDQFVLKVYHINDCVANDKHGKFIEINRAAFIMKNFKQSEFIQFYFGDVKTGYMVCQYQEDDSNKMPDKAYKGYKYDDNCDYNRGENIIGDKIIDFGGIKIYDLLLLKNTRACNIIEKIYQTSDNNRFKAWNYFYNLDSSAAKKQDILLGLAFSIRYLTKNKFDAFKMIAKDANNDLKEILALQIKYLPEENRLEAFKILAKDANEYIKKELAQQIIYLPKENRFEAFNIFAKDANNDLKDILALQIKYLPKENILEKFKILAKDVLQKMQIMI